MVVAGCAAGGGRPALTDPPAFAVEVARTSGRCVDEPRILEIIEQRDLPQLVIVCEAPNPLGRAEARIEANCVDGRWTFAVGYPPELTDGPACAP